MMKKIIIKSAGQIIDTKYCSDVIAKREAERLRKFYKAAGVDYSVRIVKA